jgi:WD40 repeat protein
MDMDFRPATSPARANLNDRAQGRGCPTWIPLALVLVVLASNQVLAQDEIRNFKTPILMVETGGHHARVRSLVWQDDFTLLSGGEDKVVKVWDFHDEAEPHRASPADLPHLARSIRPMIWRGPAGIIYAMAVSPRPDAQGQSFLAVAGYGIEARRGDITVFRIPGEGRTPTGEIVARRLPPPDNQPNAIGHTDAVTCLAFDPTGRVLASGSADTTIILWDAPAFERGVRLTGGHTRGVRTLAFSPDGTRLASGGADGSLLIWDVAQGMVIDSFRGNAARPNEINAVAYSPDRRWILVGQENPGRLTRLPIANLNAAAFVPLPTFAANGPIECIAFHPDPRVPRFAVSKKSVQTEFTETVNMSCDIEIRELPEGRLVQPARRVSGLVQALAFSPDGRRLAYAGGHAQAIQVVDPAAPNVAPREIRGAGSTPFDVRFSQDSKVVGFTRAFDPANPPAFYEGFNLERREPVTVERTNLPDGVITQFPGEWTLQPSTDPFVLLAVHTNGQVRSFAINRALEGHAWSWTLIPGRAGHLRPTVAIGTESGVAVFDLETGARTRVYAGHTSPVVSLAASRDGRWLASSSQDQTILFYPLEGCDTQAPLGVGIAPRPDGTWAIDAVEPKSFAAAMGLRKADVLVQIGIGWGKDQTREYNTAAEINQFFDILPRLEPYLYEIGIKVRRTVLLPTGALVQFVAKLPTTRRHNPALALFMGTDREWVLWTPQGYYDTSIDGDARFLGWHINPTFGTNLPTDFVPVGTFADTMYRGDVLERLWRTGVLDLAANLQAPVPVQAPAPAPAAPARAPAVVAVEDQPPRIVFARVERGVLLPAPGLLWVVDRPDVSVSLRLSASGKSAITRRRIVLDERSITPNPNVGPAPELTEAVPLRALVPNRRVRLAVEAANAAGGQRTETIDIVYVPPPPPAGPAVPEPPAPAPPRLHVLAIGCDQFAAGLPPVEYAGRDAQDLADWLALHLTSADGTRPAAEPPQVLAGEKASFRSITDACDRLHTLVQTKRVREHDIVAVVIASHLVASPQGVMIAARDTVAGNPPRPALAASDLSELLGQLTDYGCRVAAFLDGVHTLQEPQQSESKSFVRELRHKRGVITFIASKEGPSGVDRNQEHGRFALGILHAFEGPDLAGARKDRNAPYTLDEFRSAFRNEVLNLSARRQQAECYIPIQVPERTLFAAPRK